MNLNFTPKLKFNIVTFKRLFDKRILKVIVMIVRIKNIKEKV